MHGMHDFQLFASIDDEADLEGDTYVAATLLLPQQGQGIQNTFTDILQSISALQLGRYSPPTNPFKIPFFFFIQTRRFSTATVSQSHNGAVQDLLPRSTHSSAIVLALPAIG